MSALKAAPKPLPSPPAQSRMSLQALVKGRQQQPVRVMVHGPEGVGKSTFAAGAPKAIFLATEDGTAQLDITRFPSPRSWTEVLDAVRLLTLETHDFQTLVIDTLDWLEPLIWEHLCRESKVSGIEEVGGGYGKGYTAAVDQWRVLVASLEALRRAKPMHVVFLAHSSIKTFKNPEGEDFDRYELKLNLKAGGLLKEWCDAVMFANYETLTHKDARTKRFRGVSTGERTLSTERTAAFDAKNRYSLAESIPLSWADFYAGVQAQDAAKSGGLTSEVQGKLPALGEAERARAVAALARAGADTGLLTKLNQWCDKQLAERAEGEAQ